MYESDVEKDGRKKYKAEGGLLLKFTSPGVSGVPDDLGLLPIKNKRHREIVKKYINFIEFKKPGEEPSTRQKRVAKQLNEIGYNVRFIDSKDWEV